MGEHRPENTGTPVPPTQVRRPWRSTTRTVFQAIVGLAAAWALIVEALGLDPGLQWVAASLAVTGGLTRVMALPAVEVWLASFLPWLAAEPRSDDVEGIYKPTKPLEEGQRGGGGAYWGGHSEEPTGYRDRPGD